MAADFPLLLVLDLAGTFAFALNGALVAVRAARLDLVGVVALGVTTAVGGGIIRDVLLGALPPATFSDWRYLAVAAAGGLLAFLFSGLLDRLATPIEVFDAAGLSLFAVVGAAKALEYGMGPAQAVILGALTGVGGGTLRDVLIRRVPTVLTSGLYAIPALVGALLAVLATRGDVDDVLGVPASLGAAAACFVIRMVGVRFDLHAPRAPGTRRGPATPPGGSAG
ncbi:trimeric intracellular cation channel family protein [Modestobacter lapidis]|nr:trimeric intracellular cation channel family protein [Modestobacter lapidis]